MEPGLGVSAFCDPVPAVNTVSALNEPAEALVGLKSIQSLNSTLPLIPSKDGIVSYSDVVYESTVK